MDGLLFIDKPKGWTSFDVVAKVRGILRTELKNRGVPNKIKVGHTGTLDPLATGLLVVAIGKYTKKVPELTKHDKTYQATVTLGANSATDDAEGELVPGNNHKPTADEVYKALQGFLGDIQQIPPQFSAIKVAGIRSYKAARAGDSIKHEPRNVTIYSISDIKYEYPLVTFTTKVGSGTYIRSLARDLGEKLGTGAYLSSLRRTTVGDFTISAAVSPDGLNAAKIHELLKM